MNLYKLIISIVFLSFTTLVKAQQKAINFHLLNNTVKEFEKAEWDINLSAPFLNPFDGQEISLDLVLISPSGKPITLPCYFENGDSSASLWKARFTPQEAGVYRYYFSLKNKANEVESSHGNFNALPSKKPGFLHPNNLWTFRFDNGELFRAVGENVCWESRSFEDPKWTYDYLLPTLSKNKANFFRTWMCPWNLPLEWQKVNSTKRYSNTTQYFNPGGIKRMDELIHLVDSLHLYMMLTLDMNSGNWPNSPYNIKNGGPIKEWKDFFTSKTAMDKYKNKLRYLVARWGYSTNIAAWEFFNEIDNGAFTPGDSILIPHANITNWHDEMARYLKDIDPYHHMVTTSISHRDIAGLNSIAYIDFNQKHIYKHTEKIPAIYGDYIKTYGKPYVIGEYGYRWEDQDPKYAREADYDYKRGLWFGLFSPTPILPMSWWWELFDTEKMPPYLKSVRYISDMMLTAGKGNFEQVNASAGNLHVHAVKCGNTYFVYLLNETDSAIKSPVEIHYTIKAKTRLTAFYPSENISKTITGFKVTKQGIAVPGVELGGHKEMIIIANAMGEK